MRIMMLDGKVVFFYKYRSSDKGWRPQPFQPGQSAHGGKVVSLKALKEFRMWQVTVRPVGGQSDGSQDTVHTDSSSGITLFVTCVHSHSTPRTPCTAECARAMLTHPTRVASQVSRSRQAAGVPCEPRLLQGGRRSPWAQHAHWQASDSETVAL